VSINKVTTAMELMAGMELGIFAPEVVIGIAAVVAGLWFLSHAFGSSDDSMQKMIDDAKAFASAMKATRSSLTDAAALQESFRRSQFEVTDARHAVQQYKKELDKATPGTQAYRDAQQILQEHNTILLLQPRLPLTHKIC